MNVQNTNNMICNNNKMSMDFSILNRQEWKLFFAFTKKLICLKNGAVGPSNKRSNWYGLKVVPKAQNHDGCIIFYS